MFWKSIFWLAKLIFWLDWSLEFYLEFLLENDFEAISIVYSIVLQFYLERYENFFNGFASLFPCLISFSRITESLLEELFSLKLLLLFPFEIELLDNEDYKSKSIFFLGLRMFMSYSIDLAFTLLRYDFLLFLFANLYPCLCSLSIWIDSSLLLLLYIESFTLLFIDNDLSIFFFYILLCHSAFIVLITIHYFNLYTDF